MKRIAQQANPKHARRRTHDTGPQKRDMQDSAWACDTALRLNADSRDAVVFVGLHGRKQFRTRDIDPLIVKRQQQSECEFERISNGTTEGITWAAAFGLLHRRQRASVHPRNLVAALQNASRNKRRIRNQRGRQREKVARGIQNPALRQEATKMEREPTRKQRRRRRMRNRPPGPLCKVKRGTQEW